MIAYQDAIDLIRAQATEFELISVSTDQALDCVLAEDFHAPFSMPRFDNSAMDGFALRHEDVQLATVDNPITLPVLHSQAAGDKPEINKAHHAIEIMTGAAIPAETDAVIPIESVITKSDVNGNVINITITQSLSRHQNVRFSGEDFLAGQCLITAGTQLKPAHIAILYSTGTTTVRIYKAPKVQIFTTGKEVSDEYANPLEPSQIYNSNTPYLIAGLKSIGISATCAGHIGDDPQKFRELIKSHTDSQILISTGAVSKGKWDFIPTVLEELGAEILFHRVAIKPGKPVLFAKLSDGRLFFGLPGNPISAAIGLRFFIMPLIRKLLGLSNEIPSYAKLINPFKRKDQLRLFLKSHIATTPDGDLKIQLLQGQESFKIAPLLKTNAWAIIEEETSELPENAPVMFFPSQLLP